MASAERFGRDILFTAHVGRRTSIRDSRWEQLAPCLFVFPAVALMVVFIYWPLIYSCYLSTLDWNFVSPVRKFVGVANYTGLVDDKDFRLALGNTLSYVLALVPIQVLLPLALALLLWPIRRSRFQSTYRAILFTPTVLAFSVAAVCWLWIFNPIQGVLNQVLVASGGRKVAFLTDPHVAHLVRDRCVGVEGTRIQPAALPRRA